MNFEIICDLCNGDIKTINSVSNGILHWVQVIKDNIFQVRNGRFKLLDKDVPNDTKICDNCLATMCYEPFKHKDTDYLISCCLCKTQYELIFGDPLLKDGIGACCASTVYENEPPKFCVHLNDPRGKYSIRGTYGSQYDDTELHISEKLFNQLGLKLKTDAICDKCIDQLLKNHPNDMYIIGQY